MGEGDDDLGCADWSDAGTLDQSGRDLLDQLGQLSPVGFEQPVGLAQGANQAADLLATTSLVTLGVGAGPATSKLGQDRVGQR
jgi:hypothetical protein